MKEFNFSLFFLFYLINMNKSDKSDKNIDITQVKSHVINLKSNTKKEKKVQRLVPTLIFSMTASGLTATTV